MRRSLRRALKVSVRVKARPFVGCDLTAQDRWTGNRACFFRLFRVSSAFAAAKSTKQIRPPRSASSFSNARQPGSRWPVPPRPLDVDTFIVRR